MHLDSDSKVTSLWRFVAILKRMPPSHPRAYLRIAYCPTTLGRRSLTISSSAHFRSTSITASGAHHDISRRKHHSRNLIQRRLKQMMVAAIDQGDAHWIIRPNNEVDVILVTDGERILSIVGGLVKISSVSSVKRSNLDEHYGTICPDHSPHTLFDLHSAGFDLSSWNDDTLKADSTARRGAEVIFNAVGSPVFGSAFELLAHWGRRWILPLPPTSTTSSGSCSAWAHSSEI